MIAQLHQRLILGPRLSLLVPQLSALGGPADSLLDIGSGDGILGGALAEHLGVRHYVGTDPAPRGPRVAPLDRTAALPYPDRSFELVLLCDVLHHAADPRALLAEALRVCQRAVLVKDHFVLGLAAELRLRLLDWGGNAPHGAPTAARYFSPCSFTELLSQCDAELASLAWPIAVHRPLLSWLTGSELQFAAKVLPRTIS